MDTVLLKYHHLGNDYLVYDTCKNDIELDAKAIRTICSRNFGLGSQGILAGPVMSGGQMGMKSYHPDGSEARVNRNAMRIFRQYLEDAGYLERKEAVLHTEAGALSFQEDAEQEREAVAEIGKLFLSEKFTEKNHMKHLAER